MKKSEQIEKAREALGEYICEGMELHEAIQNLIVEYKDALQVKSTLLKALTRLEKEYAERGEKIEKALQILEN